MIVPFPHAEKTLSEIHTAASEGLIKIQALKDLLVKAQTFEKAADFREVEHALKNLIDVTNRILTTQ